jgi:hypothetical protein
MAFGETRPSLVFQLRRVSNHQAAPKPPLSDVDEINRINMENAMRRPQHNSNLGLPNGPTNPYLPQTPSTGFPQAPNFPSNQPRQPS